MLFSIYMTVKNSLHQTSKTTLHSKNNSPFRCYGHFTCSPMCCISPKWCSL